MKSGVPGVKDSEKLSPPQQFSTSEAFVKEVSLETEPQKQLQHVLVVEDDPIILELLQDVLSNAGFKVLIAKNASDGLALFQNYADSTFCVILDYGIPGMHASRLLERFVEVDGDVRVILSSGYPQNFIGEDFPLERIAGFMAKPYDPQILISELARLKSEQK
ncbi:MAG: response regulator [Bdellovibrionota bacterium]